MSLSTSLNHYLAWPIQGAATALQYPAAPLLRNLFNESVACGKHIEFKHYQTSASVETHSLRSILALPSGQTIGNRLVKSGITDGLCTVNGDPTPEMITSYQVYAKGGYGMIISPDVSIARESPLPCATGHTPIFDQSSNHAAFKNLAKAMKEGGSLAVLQLTHPGTVVAYANKADALFPAIADHPRGGLSQYAHELTDNEINDLFNKFVVSAKLAENCEFDGVELVLANGYLPSQFFSKAHARKGEWEGSNFLEKLLSTLVQNRNSRFVIGIKVNTEDFKSGGMSTKETADILKRLSSTGIDFIEIGGGNCEDAFFNAPANRESEREKFFRDFVEEMKQATIQIPILAVGDWRSPQKMNNAVREQNGLLIGLGRPVCIDPHLGNRILAGQVEKIPNWFQIYFPEWLKKELEKQQPDRRMIYGLEVVWHAAAVASTAKGENPPKIDGILDNPLHALAVKTHMMIRAVVPRNKLSSYYCQNPFTITDKK